MSKGEIIVVAIAGVAVILLLAYEAFALLHHWRGGDEFNTISGYVWAASYKYPLLPWSIGLITGLLAGHFFWQRTP